MPDVSKNGTISHFMRSNTMKTRSYIKVMSLMIISVFAVSLVFAQDKGGEKKEEIKKLPDGSYRTNDPNINEGNRPEDNYLAKFHAQEVVEKLMKKNIDEIYLLKVLKDNNSGKSDWNTKYTEIYNGYKDAMEVYYKRNMIYARDKLEKNQIQIRDLFKLIIADYKKQCEDLLNECASKVMLLHLDASARVDPDRSDQLSTNHLRLKVAYGQLDDAQNSEMEKYFVGAIYHLRVARAYGISILEDTAKDDAEKKSIADKYKTAKADNLNRVLSEKAGETKK
jgi:hypothetical protein